MKHRCLAQFRVVPLVVVVGVLGAVGIAGQSQTAKASLKKVATTKPWTPPLTPDGQPDLQGVWLNNSATPFERPKGLEGKPLLTHEEVAELQRRADRLFADGSADLAVGDNLFLAALGNPERYKNPNGSGRTAVWMPPRQFDDRTSLVVDPPDGKLPALTLQAQQRRTAARARERTAAGPEDLNNAVRCITNGVPRTGSGANGDPQYGYYQILQSPGYVVILMETIHDARIVPLDGRPHLQEGVTQWNGDSRGRWDGHTLIVDTTPFSSKSDFLGSSEHLHLIERFTRIAPDQINYEATLIDPTTWIRPWTVDIRLKQMQTRTYEFACHEGNSSMMGILAGARAEEKAAEEAAKGPK